MMTRVSRRAALIGATLSSVALAVPAVALARKIDATESTDAELMRLGAEFERLWAAEEAANPGHPYEGNWAAWEAAYERTDKVAKQIVDKPTRTLEGFRLKARVIQWCYGTDPVNIDDHGTTDLRLAQAIVRDLLSA